MQLPDVQQWLLYMLAALAVWWVVSRIRKRRAAKRAAQHRAAAHPRQSTQRQPARRQPPPLPRRTPDPAPLASQARPLPPRRLRLTMPTPGRARIMSAKSSAELPFQRLVTSATGPAKRRAPAGAASLRGRTWTVARTVPASAPPARSARRR